MRQKNITISFLFTLCGLLFTACDRHDTDSPDVNAVGVVSFGVNYGSPLLTKGSGDDGGWETVNMPLSRCKRNVSPSADSVYKRNTVAKPSTTPSVLTKGTPVTGTSSPIGSIGVLGYLLPGGTWNESTSTPDFMYNTQLTRKGSAGSYTYSYYPAKYWPDNENDKVRFFAYYPHNGNGVTLSGQTAAGCPTITYTSGSTVTNQVDLMYAHASAVNNKATGNSVNLALSHALTRIGFSAKLAPEYTSQTVIIQSIQITGLKSGGTLALDPSDATPWTLGAGTVSYTLSTDGGELIPTVNQALSSGDYLNITTPAGYLLCPPQSITTSNTIVVNFTVDGVTNTATYSLPAATWSMGQSVNYQLTLPFPTANCYIIAPGASLTIPVNVRGNGGDVAGTGLSTGISPASVGVVWQSASNLITSITSNSISATITTNSTPATGGNAVIAAYSGTDQTGTILWSWHIWVTTYDPNTPSNGAVYTYNSRTWMDRNLGATTATAATPTTLGLLYQWGRKDPFPGSASFSSGAEPTIYNKDGTSYTCMATGAPVIKEAVSANSNFANTILYPGTFYYGTSVNSYDWYSVAASTHNTALWGGSDITPPAAKTIFDPCPAGWRVPAYSNSVSPWYGFGAGAPGSTYNSYTAFPWYSSVSWETGYGRVYTSAGNTYYPAAGYRGGSSGSLLSMGSSGYYWSASPYSSNGYSLYFYSSYVNPSPNYNRAYGFAVRCIQE